MAERQRGVRGMAVAEPDSGSQGGPGDGSGDGPGDASGTGAEGAAKPARYHHGGLKAALIDATLTLIAEKRLEEVSVADAARAAGVSSGAPYRHFEDREDLFAHVAAVGFDALQARLQAAWDSRPAGSVEGVIEGGRAYTRFGAERPELFHVMWGATRGEDVAHEAGMSCYGSFVRQITITLEAQGMGHLDAHHFGAPLHAMVHGFTSLLIGKGSRLEAMIGPVEERIAEATHAYFDGARVREGVAIPSGGIVRQ